MSTKIKRLVLISACFLSACSTTDIKPIGKDTYMVAGTRSGYSSGGEVLAELYDKGYKFCETNGLSFVAVHENSRDGVPGFRLASGTIQFRCVPNTDPEANQRPTLKKEPDVVIENQN